MHDLVQRNRRSYSRPGTSRHVYIHILCGSRPGTSRHVYIHILCGMSVMVYILIYTIFLNKQIFSKQCSIQALFNKQ
jgi:hypothetical protein